jgi:hypothetical protein
MRKAVYLLQAGGTTAIFDCGRSEGERQRWRGVPGVGDSAGLPRVTTKNTPSATGRRLRSSSHLLPTPLVSRTSRPRCGAKSPATRESTGDDDDDGGGGSGGSGGGDVTDNDDDGDDGRDDSRGKLLRPDERQVGDEWHLLASGVHAEVAIGSAHRR